MSALVQCIHPTTSTGSENVQYARKKTVKKQTIKQAIHSIRTQMDQEPSIVPIVFGISSIFGAFIGCLWNNTRFASPLLGTFGTILLLFGANTRN